jgi:pimeloyl-ACP methyl ester carboxylesterase
MVTSSIVKTKDGIEWYVEQQGSGPHIVMVPSGEGDCESFAKTASVLAKDFTVTTFDMPGMSRSAVAPIEAITNVSGQMLATQIHGLLDELKIEVATIYGCSSSALAAIFLMIDHPDKVQSIIIHEAPLRLLPFITALQNMGDAELVKTCQDTFVNYFNEDMAAWEALGPEFHARLAKNYITWIRGYTRLFDDLSWSNEELKRRPVTWTIGGKMPAASFYDNVVVATKAGIEIGLLDSKHFPQVSIPEALAEHIKNATLKYL